MQKKKCLKSIIILILILQWHTLTAQSRDDRIKEVVSNYIYVVQLQSNTINSLEYELYTKNVVLTNMYRVMETERELHNIDLKIVRAKSAKRVIIAGGAGAVFMGAVIAGLKYIFR